MPYNPAEETPTMPDHRDRDYDYHDGGGVPPTEPESQNWRAWLLGAFFTLATMFGMAGFNSLNSRLTTLEQYGSPPFRERIAAVEARQMSMQRQQEIDAEQIREAMKRIESKLDDALDRLHAARIGR